MTPHYRKTTRCLVCGFTEVRTDEVVEDGVLLLAECPRCEHRWTERERPAARPVEVRTGVTGGTPVEVHVHVEPVEIAA